VSRTTAFACPPPVTAAVAAGTEMSAWKVVTRLVGPLPDTPDSEVYWSFRIERAFMLATSTPKAAAPPLTVREIPPPPPCHLLPSMLEPARLS
jgi:hypothetical protein